jgi:uncharacterized phiE125 gp8 family phage protein
MSALYNHPQYSLVKPINYILTAKSVAPAVELDEIKEQLRETSGTNAFDTQLLALIDAATQFGENLTGRDFINKSYRCYLDCFPSNCQGIQIRKSKLQSIISIQYYKDGILTPVDSSSYYFTDSNNYSSIYLTEGSDWPTDIDHRKQALIIEFVSGYGDDSCDIPPLLRQALISHIIALFKNAGDCVDNQSQAQYKSLYYSFILSNLLVCPI